MRTDPTRMLPRMIPHRFAVAVMVVFLFASFLSTPTLAAAFGEEALAVIYIEASALSFVPRVKAAGWVLEITSAEGTVTRLEFSADETPVLEMGGETARLPDGTYSYSLRSRPLGAAASGVQSGSFSIEEGEITIEAAEPGSVVDLRGMLDEGGVARAPAIAMQQVINNSLVVLGSACVGFDCANPSFGFTTLGLAEHNLRLMFRDTSSAASFPRNDWMIQINDSANGGLNFFGVIDCGTNSALAACGGTRVFAIEAGAPSNSLFVDDGGRLGIRTSTPSTEIHSRDGDTPALRLQQDGSSGFAPQTWDIAGNETNFFVRDVTNGSTLPFRIRPGAPTSSIDIDSEGEVGIGTQSPDAQLDIEVGSVDDRIGLKVNGPGDSSVNIQEWDVDGTQAARLFLTDAARQFFMDSFDNGTSFGPNVFIDRNSNSSTPAAGQLIIRNRNNQQYVVWPDATGNLRIHTDFATSVNDLAGSVVGDQTSWHAYKAYEPWDEAGALETVVRTDLYRFQYLETGYRAPDGGTPSFYGLVGFERDDWFLKNVGPRQVPAINELTLFGHLIASIKSLDKKIETQQQTIDGLMERLAALETVLANQEKR